MLAALEQFPSESQRLAKVRTCLGCVYAGEARANALIKAVRALPDAPTADALLNSVTGLEDGG